MAHETTKRQTRPPVQRDRIVADLRQGIVKGKYPVGTQLPTRKELIHRYTTGPGTVQEALDRLRLDGFIETRGRSGTYVASRPPHLHRYGMVFEERPVRNTLFTSSFYQALMDVAKRDRQRQIDFFYLTDPFHDRDREEYKDLLETVLNDRIAGLLFTFNPYLLRPTPVLQKRGLPRVGVMQAKTLPGLGSVYVDYAQWMARALDAVKARGCRRVAFLGSPHVEIPKYFEQGIHERGLTTHDLWIQAVPVAGVIGPWLGRLVRLMMAGPVDSRPEALVIADDNLVEQATAGLVEAGLRSSQDVHVVAHANFPRVPPSARPIEWLGFDVHTILQTCWDLVDHERRGRPTPSRVQLVPPIFENEFKSNAVPLVAAREGSQASAN